MNAAGPVDDRDTHSSKLGRDRNPAPDCARRAETPELEDDETAWSSRPRLRGRLHLAAAVVSVAGLVWLVRSAGSWQARLGAWIYGVACVLLYATSSAYHVFTRSPAARRRMRSLDHAMIFVLIAGTFTPLCILAMTEPWRWYLLSAVWLTAGIGVTMTMHSIERFKRLSFVLYLVLGWAGLVVVPALIAAPWALVSTVSAGVLYTVGAVLFSMHRPRLHPRWFGYHEVWHAIGLCAGSLLFVVNLGLVRAAS